MFPIAQIPQLPQKGRQGPLVAKWLVPDFIRMDFLLPGRENTGAAAGIRHHIDSNLFSKASGILLGSISTETKEERWLRFGANHKLSI